MEMLRAEPWCYYPLTLQVICACCPVLAMSHSSLCHMMDMRCLWLPMQACTAAAGTATANVRFARPRPSHLQFLSSTYSALRGRCPPPPVHMQVLVAPLEVRCSFDLLASCLGWLSGLICMRVTFRA